MSYWKRYTALKKGGEIKLEAETSILFDWELQLLNDVSALWETISFGRFTRYDLIQNWLSLVEERYELENLKYPPNDVVLRAVRACINSIEKNGETFSWLFSGSYVDEYSVFDSAVKRELIGLGKYFNSSLPIYPYESKFISGVTKPNSDILLVITPKGYNKETHECMIEDARGCIKVLSEVALYDRSTIASLCAGRIESLTELFPSGMVETTLPDGSTRILVTDFNASAAAPWLIDECKKAGEFTYSSQGGVSAAPCAQGVE